MELMIKSVDRRFEEVAEIIRDSFITVANELKITRESAPTNPAFLSAESLVLMEAKGVEMYIAYEGSQPVGFVALEKVDQTTGYLEKLAVLPAYRHKGYGKKLVLFVLGRAKALGIKRVSIGIINENTVLKNWYTELGFRETGTKRFPNLPFEVCFMEYMFQV